MYNPTTPSAVPFKSTERSGYKTRENLQALVVDRLAGSIELVFDQKSQFLTANINLQTAHGAIQLAERELEEVDPFNVQLFGLELRWAALPLDGGQAILNNAVYQWYYLH